jgi:hypothetical protein
MYSIRQGAHKMEPPKAALFESDFTSLLNQLQVRMQPSAGLQQDSSKMTVSLT